MMGRSIRNMAAILAVLLVSVTARAELQLVANFEGLSGNPDGQPCNGVLGGTLDTNTEGTGNSSLPAIDGSTTMSVIGHSSGTIDRAIGFGGIDNPIDNTETGIGFFRLRVSAGNIRPHMGLVADTTDNPVNGTNNLDPMTVPAGFRLVANGAGFDVVTADGATVLKAGLATAQWYNVWIVADNAADTFDLYLGEAPGPAGPATLPGPGDLVERGIPFNVATTDPLNGMIFANPRGTGQAARIHVDEIWWDGDQGLSKPTKAGNPSPAQEQSDVPRDVTLGWTPGASAATHDVYFGTSADAVGNADKANPLGVLASEGQDASTYAPAGPLEFGQTYYWRVDEVNAAPDFTVFRGDVWSFTVEPLAYPITNLTATASSAQVNMGPENTVNGSGLNADDQHSTEPKEMWLSTADQPVWIQYEFDRAYKLHDLQVWNSNQLIEAFVGFGVKDVTVEYSADGAEWTALEGVPEFAQATGTPDYTANTVVNFGGIMAKYVRLTVNSSWGGVPQAGLSEVRFTYIPVLPREPQPAAGAAGVEVDAVLSWRAGREAASHQVYLSTDQQAVVDGTAPVETVSEGRFDPDALDLGTLYHWKVAEVNDAETPSVWEGEVWSFTTREYLVVDDFESYTDDEGSRIYETWIDGYTDGNSGSIVGYFEAPFAERSIVHGGKQSMPFEYNNLNTPFYSEAYREFSPVQDWTANGADTLSLWIRGNPVAFFDDGGVITMGGAGHDIWDNADDFRFAHKTLSGNGSIVVRVESLVNTHNWAKAGVMVRQSLDADSKFAYMIVSAAQGVSFGWRPLVAGACSSVNQEGIAAPQWVKLIRTGDAFTAQYSADGQTWMDLKNTDGTIATTTVAMTDPVYIGLCVTSHNAAATTTAVMSDAETTGTVTGPWQVAAIGDDPQPANSAAPLYVTIQDSAGKTATATNLTAVTSAEWTQWQIPLSSLAGVNLTRVEQIYIGVGDRQNPIPAGGGRLYIDDIGFGRPASAE